MFHRLWFVVFLFSSGLLAPVTVLGQTTAFVSIPGSQAGREAADLLFSELERGLEVGGIIAPSKSRELFRAGVGAEALSEAHSKAQAATKAVGAFEDLESTSTQLEEAIDAHLRLLPLLENLDVPLRLLMDIATIELALGNEEKIDESFEIACRLDPAFHLDPQEVPPRLAAAAESASVSATNEPLLTAELAYGFAKKLNVSRVLVAQPRPDSSRIRVEEYSRDGERLRSWNVDGGDASPLLSELTGGGTVGSEGAEGPVNFSTQVEESPVEEAHRDVEGSPRRWYRRWWVWTLIGSVVVAGGAATGVVLGLRAREPEDLTMEVQSHW